MPQIHRDRKQNGRCQGLGEGETWELQFNGYRIPVEADTKSSEDGQSTTM